MAMRLANRRKKEPDSSINLLPSDIKAEQNTKRMFTIAVAGAVGLIILLLLITVFQRIQINSAQHTLTVEQAKAAALQTEVEALREFEVLKASVDGTRAALGTALAGDISWTRFLDDLDTFMPTDAYLTTVNVTALPGTTPQGETSLGTTQFTGTVTSFPGLAHWLDTMEAIKGFRFVYLTNGSKSGQPGDALVSFSANGHVTDELLSHRCESEGSKCP